MKNTIASLFEAIYPEVVLFGTNCILKFCHHAPTFRSNNDRYKFKPTNDELADALRLFLLCVIHRYELFYMNSINRRDLVEPISLDILLDVYNRRLNKRWKPQMKETISAAIILPVSVHTLPLTKREWRCRNFAGTEQVLTMRNYMPFPCDADSLFQRFTYLDTIGPKILARTIRLSKGLYAHGVRQFPKPIRCRPEN